jgi:hypothetical protein
MIPSHYPLVQKFIAKEAVESSIKEVERKEKRHMSLRPRRARRHAIGAAPPSSMAS